MFIVYSRFIAPPTTEGHLRAITKHHVAPERLQHGVQHLLLAPQLLHRGWMDGWMDGWVDI